MQKCIELAVTKIDNDLSRALYKIRAKIVFLVSFLKLLFFNESMRIEELYSQGVMILYRLFII